MLSRFVSLNGTRVGVLLLGVWETLRECEIRGGVLGTDVLDRYVLGRSSLSLEDQFDSSYSSTGNVDVKGTREIWWSDWWERRDRNDVFWAGAAWV